MNRSYKYVDKYNFYIIIVLQEVILMHKEYECTILEVDVDSFISKIEKMGAKKLVNSIKKDMYMILILAIKINGLD